MKKYKFLQTLVLMLLLFSLLVSAALLFQHLINQPDKLLISSLFSPIPLIFLLLICTVVAYYFQSKLISNLFSDYEIKSIAFQSLSTSKSIGMIISTIEGDVIFLNEYAKKALNINNSKNLYLFDLLPLTNSLEEDKEFSDKKETTLFKEKIKVNDKEEKIFDFYFKEIEIGNSAVILCLFSDIIGTNKILEFEYRYKTLLNSIEDAIAIVNKNGVVEDCNIAFAKLLQTDTNEILNKNFISFIQGSQLLSSLPPGYHQKILEKMSYVFETGDISQIPNPLKFEVTLNQKKRHFLHKIFKVEIGSDEFLLGSIISDISDLQATIDKLNEMNFSLEQTINKKIEELKCTVEQLIETNQILKKEIKEKTEISEELKKSQETYKNFIENLPVGVYKSTSKGKILFANRALAKILECNSAEELMNISAYAFYKTREKRNEVVKSHMSNVEALIKVDTEMITKNGRKIFVNDFARVINDPETGELYFEGIIIDITEKYLYEQKLRKSELRFRQLFERINDILLQTGQDGTIEVVSPSIKPILGYEADELLGKNIKHLLNNPTWFDKLKKILHEENEARNILLEFKTSSGSIKYLKGDYFQFAQEEGTNSIQIILSDETEEIEVHNLMNAIFAVFKTFNQDKSIYEIAENIIRAFQYITVVPNFIFALKDPETNTLKIIRHSDRFGLHLNLLDLSDTSHPIVNAFIKKKTLTFSEKELEGFWGTNKYQIPSYLIALPIISQNEILGVIAIYSYYAQLQELSKTKIYHLNSLVEQISFGLQRQLLSEKLDAQLNLLDVLIESIPYPIYYRSLKSNKYLFCNSAFELHLEKPREEIIGKTLDEVLPKELVEKTLKMDYQILKDLQTQTYQTTLKDSLGNEKTFIAIRSIVISEEQDEKGVVGILIDITERLKYEEELKKALEFNKLILNLVPSAIFTTNSERKITSWNRQAELITGYHSEEVIGKTCFICELNKDHHICQNLIDIKSNELIEEERKFTNKYGQKLILSSKITTMKDTKGKIIGVIESFEDITAKKEFENRLTYLADTNYRITTISNLLINIEDINVLIDSVLPIALQITNSEGVYFIELSKNLDYHNINRLIAYSISGKESYEVKIPLEKFINSYLGKVFIDRESLSIDFAESNKLIPELKFLASSRFILAPLQSGEEFHGFLLAYNKESQYTDDEISALERLALVLATNIERISYQNELQNILVKQYQMNELRSNFVNLISHEYRTPLQAILLSSEILQKHLNTLPQDQIEKQLQRIDKAVKDMSAMLENVIQYNKLTRPLEKISLEAVNSKVFFDSLIKDFMLYYQDRAKFNYVFKTTLEKINVDYELIQLIFSNIISNAVKYSQPNPKINITVNISEKNISIAVSDNGIGIDENEIPHIFQPFYKGKNTKNIGGTGLGLSIVQNVVNLLGGTILVKSKLGKGTTFEIQLPIA